MTIDAPKPSDITALKLLWREAFGDSEEFVDSFFRTAYSPERCRAVRAEGKPVSALYLFDCALAGERIAYIYAVATLKAYRGRGLCAALMEDTHRLLSELGYAGAVLVPGTAELFKFYEKFGYRSFGGISEKRCAASDSAATLYRIDAAEYASLRRAMLPEGGIIQEGESLSFLESYAELYCGKDILLAARREKCGLFCAELLGNAAAAPEILRALNCEEGMFRTVGNERSFAMFVPLSDRSVSPTYFGLAFD